MIITNIEQLRALLPSVNLRNDSHRVDDFILRAQQWVAATIIGTGIETALDQPVTEPDEHAELRLLVQRVIADKAYLLMGDEMNLQLGEAGMVVQTHDAVSAASYQRRDNLMASLETRLDHDGDALVTYLIQHSLPDDSIDPEHVTNVELDVDTDNMHLMGDPGVAYQNWRGTEQYARMTVAFMPTLEALRSASPNGKATLHWSQLYDSQQAMANGLIDVASSYCSTAEILRLVELYRDNTLTVSQMAAVASLRCCAAFILAGDKEGARQAAIRARKVMLAALTDFTAFAESPERTMEAGTMDGGYLVNTL